MALAPFQRELAASISALEGEPASAALLARVRADRGVPAERRIEIYAHAYFARLHDALREDYPALHAALGEAAFHDLAKLYLMAHPPASFTLRLLGARLPEFLRAPAADLFRARWPFAPDLAALEWAVADLFDAEDRPLLERAALAALPADAWPELRFTLIAAWRGLALDWPAFYWLPADVFGPGKVLAMAEVLERDGTPYGADSRGLLKQYTEKLFAKDGTTCYAANEIEGFLFRGRDAERRYHETGKFEFISTGGYYHSLPGDALRLFIDSAAEVQRAMGFANEKDHPEVAPSQFEMNYNYAEAVIAADQVQLYKLLSRQVAARMDMTACFLPKPVTGVNGNGMHTNVSVARKGKNLFWDEKGQDQLSQAGWDFIKRILSNGAEICLLLNSSVNSYRRLDPHFEAPNQIKASPIDRGSMIRIPLGNERSKRVEVRSIAPDANPYLAIYTIFKTGLEGPSDASKTEGAKYLSDNIYDAIRLHQSSRFLKEALGADVHGKFAELKQMQADRCPKALGAEVKAAEIQFHHEVTNQYLWSKF